MVSGIIRFFQNLNKLFYHDSLVPSKYRTSNIIIQTILEGILRADRDKLFIEDGIIKSHLIDYANLKTQTAQKYLDKMETAGYISSEDRSWGERTVKIYKITKTGKERYKWFATINSEMEEM